MLYDCWRQVASRNAGQIALCDLATNRRWTFSQLAAAVEIEPPAAGRVVFPQGGSADFILTILRAWRTGQVVCPVEPGHPAPPMSGPLPAEIVHLKTTSATTGTPRLVAFSARQLAADAEHIVQAMGLQPDWPNLGVISLAHSYGFSNLVLPLLLHGIPLVLVGSALPEAVRQAAATQPAVTLAAVPALWRTWHEARALPANLRLAISAGAPLPVALEQTVFAQHGIKIHNFYGSSECGGIAYDSSTQPRQDGACVGRPMPGVDVSLGASGCVEVRGTAVAATYWPEPSSNLSEGVFRTSDLGELVDGWLYLRGRASDQINVAGRKVSPEVIERTLASHPQVRDCLAFGVPSADAQRGETIVACVASHTTITREALKQFAMTHLPAWQVPREWWLVEALEVNGRGKLSRTEWRQRFLEKSGHRKNGIASH